MELDVAIRVERLTKRFGRYVALDEVSFEVASGELIALLGPSGSGKSTILRIIAGLERADTGHVHLDGERVDHLSSPERRVGFVFQHYALFRHMTVADNVAFGLSVRGASKEAQAERAHELLDLVGLAGLGDRLPRELSGGQRQRVALARALAPSPRLLLLDEPFGAIDAKVRAELRRWLRKLHDEMHVTSLFVTHDQDEAFDVADRVVLVAGGRIEQVGSPREILEAPKSEFAAKFFGDVNVFDATMESGRACAGKLAASIDGFEDGTRVRLLIRSYDLKLWKDDAGIGVVQRMIPLGDRVRVEATVDGAGDVRAHFPRRSSLLKGVSVGTRVAVEVTLARAYAV
jgi:sulfate transport system ATP-binding protein